jgi:ADP-heptose:LPS heptosyltransferase
MRVFVYRPGAIGETVLTLPALAALRARYPGCHITYAGNAAMVGLLPVEEALSADDRRLLPLFGEPARPFAEFDLEVSFSKVVFGVQRDPLEAVARGLHVADWLVDVIDPGFADRAPRLDVGAGQGAELVLLPGAGSRGKRWPAERFAALARGLGWRTAVVEGPADEEAVAAVLAGGIEAEVWRGRSLPELAGKLADSRLVVGNDSGITHLAAAVGAPTVALYVSTDAAIWGIRGERTRRLSGVDIDVEEVASNGTAIAAAAPGC